MKIHSIALFLMMFGVGLVSAAEKSPAFVAEFPKFEQLFSQQSRQLLKQELSTGKEGINRFFTSDEKPSHVPGVQLSVDLLQAANRVDYTVAVESLYLIRWEDINPQFTRLTRDNFMLEIYNILRSVSSLEGIEYYSASQERMRTFFEECWAINNPEERKRIPDPLVSSIPPLDAVYIHQKDLTFGKNRSRVEYQSAENHFRMGIVNITTMTYMLFPIVGKENMSMQFLVIPTDEGIVFYGLNTVKVLDLPIFYKKMESSFSNRMSALFSWFQNQVQHSL
ncbi:MAG TPA: hypothetical protein ENN41_06545 [Sediminispirochaeta sp.]|nr:hypothetical protein [Sediminispirochaeta sp.]